ncbi:hypothetical protein [Planctomonas deserti]|uniref:hypothetical protein n=1 Tax=Planctomonas deserti TaxID=2144185 RepID=UPI000D39E1E6|nr:hypothetical protein [Planctomonas deserti]
MRRTQRAAAVTLVAAVLLTGCTAPVTDSPSRTESPPESVESLPGGITVAVQQSRSDVAQRRLKVSVTNDGPDPFVVTGLRLSAPQFTEPVVWPKDSTTVRPGTTVDLPVALASPDCSADGPPTVTLRFLAPDAASDADPPEHEATVAPDDPFDRLPALRAEDCLAEAVAAVTTITVPGPVRLVDAGGSPAAVLDLVVSPTGAKGSVAIDSVTGTTLLAPADPDTGDRRDELTIGAVVDADAGTTTIPLTFVPNRCDAHAIAEDKRGTILPLHVTGPDGVTGIVPVPVDEATRSALYASVAEACGLS